MPIQIGDIKIYSLKEIAEPLRVTPVTLRKYIGWGSLKGQKVGQKWYVTEESLREFFNKIWPTNPEKGERFFE